jgi:hypothetical protein
MGGRWDGGYPVPRTPYAVGTVPEVGVTLTIRFSLLDQI